MRYKYIHIHILKQRNAHLNKSAEGRDASARPDHYDRCGRLVRQLELRPPHEHWHVQLALLLRQLRVRHRRARAGQHAVRDRCHCVTECLVVRIVRGALTGKPACNEFITTCYTRM